jgi:C1A family cysteine protease
LLAFVALVSAKSSFNTLAHTEFAVFKEKYNKEYKSVDEEFMRYRIFRKNLKRIAKLNLRSKGRNNFGVTKFTDLTPSEFSHMYLMPKRPKPVIREEDVLNFTTQAPELPAQWDWRTDGLKGGVSCITKVYNQGQCGSCWAFSATEEIESMTFLQTSGASSPDNLSMQQIVDCCTAAYGCQGGWTYVAYQYVEQAGGLDSLASYPYTAQNGQCEFNKANVEAKISSWKYVTQSENEGTMKQFAATTGPMSICVDASSWQFYQGGVLSNCGNQIDHCVQITGYSTQQGVEAWNVRNSWGTDWGVSGYIYLEYGQNTCALADVVTTVTGTELN